MVQSDEESDPEKKEVKEEEEEKNSPDSKAGAASKGPNAIAPNKAKAAPDTKKVNNLKRPGSPNLSELESSGNESTRKRPKKTATGSVRGSRASTPVPGSQQRSLRNGGAASDGEGTGAEMSDGGRPKIGKKKVVVGSHSKGTPAGSRAGSPVPGSSQAAAGKLTLS